MSRGMYIRKKSHVANAFLEDSLKQAHNLHSKATRPVLDRFHDSRSWFQTAWLGKKLCKSVNKYIRCCKWTKVYRVCHGFGHATFVKFW